MNINTEIAAIETELKAEGAQLEVKVKALVAKVISEIKSVIPTEHHAAVDAVVAEPVGSGKEGTATQPPHNDPAA